MGQRPVPTDNFVPRVNYGLVRKMNVMYNGAVNDKEDEYETLQKA